MHSRLALIATSFAIAAHAQQPAPAFDVASIRPNISGQRIMLFQPRHGGRFTANNCSLELLIGYAYDIMRYQISGAPDWVKSGRYDVAAKAEGDPPVDELRLMLQRLLEDRFQLKYHWDTKQAAVYHLLVSKPGKLKEVEPDDCPSIFSPPGSRPGAPLPDDAPCGSLRNTPGDTKGYRLTAEELAGSLAWFVQRSVLDKTGLAGKYDIELR